MASPQVTFRLPEPTLERLRSTVQAQGRTLSDVIRGAVADRLQADGPEQAPDDEEAV